MSKLRKIPSGSLGKDFIPAEFLPAGQDEHYLRNEQSARSADGWRKLRADEIEALVKNANACDNWDNILVTGQFSVHLIKNCEFHGLVRIGRLDEVYLEHHDLRVPVGRRRLLLRVAAGPTAEAGQRFAASGAGPGAAGR